MHERAGRRRAGRSPGGRASDVDHVDGTPAALGRALAWRAGAWPLRQALAEAFAFPDRADDLAAEDAVGDVRQPVLRARLRAPGLPAACRAWWASQRARSRSRAPWFALPLLAALAGAGLFALLVRGVLVPVAGRDGR